MAISWGMIGAGLMSGIGQAAQTLAEENRRKRQFWLQQGVDIAPTLYAGGYAGEIPTTEEAYGTAVKSLSQISKNKKEADRLKAIKDDYRPKITDPEAASMLEAATTVDEVMRAVALNSQRAASAKEAEAVGAQTRGAQTATYNDLLSTRPDIAKQFMQNQFQPTITTKPAIPSREVAPPNITGQPSPMLTSPVGTQTSTVPIAGQPAETLDVYSVLAQEQEKKKQAELEKKQLDKTADILGIEIQKLTIKGKLADLEKERQTQIEKTGKENDTSKKARLAEIKNIIGMNKDLITAEQKMLDNKLSLITWAKGQNPPLDLNKAMQVKQEKITSLTQENTKWLNQYKQESVQPTQILKPTSKPTGTGKPIKKIVTKPTTDQGATGLEQAVINSGFTDRDSLLKLKTQYPMRYKAFKQKYYNQANK